MDVKEKTKQGRKTSSAYDLYGFIPQFNCGKHSALCKSCNRVLQNTASARLLKHRNACSAVIGSRNLPKDSPKEAKRRRGLECRNEPAKIPHREPEEENPQQQIENDMTHNEMEISQVENSSVSDFIKVELNTCVAENPYVEDSVAATTTAAAAFPITSTQLRLSQQSDEAPQTTASMTPQIIKTEEDVPISTPARPVPFESYHLVAIPQIVEESDTDLDDEDDADLINIEDELDVIQNLMPRSKESLQLQEELYKAETEYYNTKALYFGKLTENTKIKRTLMILQSRKLQLEIEKLKNGS